jgi:hypothetical protein
MAMMMELKSMALILILWEWDLLFTKRMVTKMNEKKLRKKITRLMKKAGYDINYIDINNYKTTSRNEFFDKHSDIWDRCFNMYDGNEVVEINKINWLLNEYSLKENFPLSITSWVEEILYRYADEHIEELKKNNPDFDESQLTLNMLREDFPEEIYRNVYEDIMYEIENGMEFYDIEDLLTEMFGVDYPDEQFNEAEALGYWTVYFEPKIFDEKIAWECGLYPFEFDGMELLALGGCGMDLSPKLDCYQAMTDGTVDSSSMFLRDDNYAKYVVGNDRYNKVMEIITRDTPKITIDTWIDNRPKPSLLKLFEYKKSQVKNFFLNLLRA